MFRFLTALARLTTSINRSADLFDAANVHLEQQLGFDASEPAALPAPSEEAIERAQRNGRTRTKASV